MSYTLVRVAAEGVVLLRQHERRFQGGAQREGFVRLVAAAQPGIWAVSCDAARGVEAEQRPASRLHDGMPARLLPSPVADRIGPIAKPRPPGPYAAVRQDGMATLLTSADGSELLEACSAAVVGWDGSRIVCVPSDRPRVWSAAEAAIREHLPFREEPIAASSSSLLLVNAVKGTCSVEGRSFPGRVRGEIEELFARLTSRVT